MRRLAISGVKCSVALVGIMLLAGQAAAAADAFAPFPGEWRGDGTIRFGDGAKERMRCTANYEVRGSSGHELNLAFRCRSDNYTFDLDGRVVSDKTGELSGQWTETSRNIGGTAFGKVDGERVRVRIEASGFGANLLIGVRDNRQSVSIKSQGGGQQAEAQITLRRK